MSNYYNHGSVPQNGTLGDAAEIGAEFDAIQSDISDKLPVLTGNGGKVVKVNSGATALESQAADALIAATIVAATAKTTPVDADSFALIDSAASSVLKETTFANIKTTLGTTFAALAGSSSQAFACSTLTASGAISGTTITGTALTITHATSATINSQTTSGYAGFQATSSGTNSAYLFLGNVTTGERGRITADNTATLYFGVGNAATTALTLAATTAIFPGAISGTTGTFAQNAAGSNGVLHLTDTDTGAGVNIKMVGDGATTPNKHIRVKAGVYEVVNSAYSNTILQLTDAGDLTVDGAISGTTITGSGAISGTTITGSGIVRGNTATGTTTSAAVVGVASGAGHGVYGEVPAAGGTAISGDASAGAGTGVVGYTDTGKGVYGWALGAGYGVVAESDTTSPGRSAFRIVPQNAEPNGSNSIGDIYVTSAGVLKICTVAGTPGTWVSVGTQT